MPFSDVLSEREVFRLPPMIFGRIRWKKHLGAPVGDPAMCFMVFSEKKTVSQFRMGPSGPEVIPGTGEWQAAVNVQCSAAPDEGDMHVVAFSVPDVHLNAFPDGQYRVRAELTGKWAKPPINMKSERVIPRGFKRIDPFGYYVSLKKDHHIVSLDFEVVHEPLRLRP